MSQFKHSGTESKSEQPSSTSLLTLDLSDLDDALPLWGGQSASFGPPFHMLLSSRNTLTDTSRDNV